MPAIAIALGVLASVAAAQPSAPRGLAAAPGDAEATLSWTDPSNDAITGYSVRYATSAAALSSASAAWSAISGGDAASVAHTVRRLTNGARYYFQVRATDADGDGPPSNVATTRLAASPTAVVAITDSGLRAALERSLRVAAGADITQLDLATLSGRFIADHADISDLTGLEHAVNLAALWLRYNTISDVSALGSLESLTELLLDDNAISDVSVLGSLESLTRLVLNYNEITDISALGSLESLTELGLWENAISDVSVLGSLESLTSLGLQYNEITDISALGSLESLTELWLGGNAISDVSVLGSLESLTVLQLEGNAIEDVSALGSLESLTTLYLQDNAISDVSALGSLGSLTLLELSGNTISDVSALGSLESLTVLRLSGNTISDVSALGSLESLTILGLSGNAISDVSALGSLESLTWLYLQDNEISDVSALGSLESLTRLWLSGNTISDVSALGSLESLTRLWLSSNAISDVSALGSLESMTWLYLQDNEISDVSALGSLESLTILGLSGNTISDVSALGSLESLTRLWLSSNAISDVSALGSLESLTILGLSGNTISDVSALGSLESLTRLELHNNAIEDVSVLGSLGSLMRLSLQDNAISDVSALGSLESLTWLYLQDNEISDVSALGSLESLTRLWLSSNAISDVSALGSLGSLTTLHLQNNTISDVSALGSLESLTTLYLRNNTISDVSAFGSLQSLERLDLSGNRIAGVTPLVGAGIGVVGLRGNPLSADSMERHVPALRDAGTAVVAGWPVPLFPSAADSLGRQGFVRVVNRSAIDGEVLIDAVDDAGERFGPLRLAIGAGEATHFNSQDLEEGNAAKGLSGGVVAPTAGHWRLALSSTLDIEVLSYIRTPAGFVTSVHDTLPRQAPSVLWYYQESPLYAAVFNPGSNSEQRSSLRLMNPGGDERMDVFGWDDRGRYRGASLVSVPAGGAATVDAAALEAGGIGDGAGKWRLEVNVRWPVEGASLLTSPSGLLTNLSTVPSASVNGVWRVPLFPAADGASGREGVVRVINRSWQAGEIRVVAVDDGGARVGPVTLVLQRRQTVHFNSGDLQRGNAAKGLRDGVGSPTRGDWRLELTSDLDIAVMSYVRAPDGFLTSMHDLAPPGVPAQVVRVPTFNPGSNQQQVGLLRVMNAGDRSAAVRVAGVDSAGMPSGEVRLTVPAGEARTLTAADLEAGDAAFEGALGDGVDKWRLDIASDVPVSVMSLLQSPTGHLTNLSTGTRP